MIQPIQSIAMAKEQLHNEIQISDARIKYVLAYVKPTKQRVLKCTIKDMTINALLRCETPDYTINPVEYLSSSELMVSTAQVGHILIDCYIRKMDFQYSTILNIDRLKYLRENHEIYFVEMNFQFHKKILSNNYEMEMSLENFKNLKGNFVAKFKFNVSNGIIGNFIAFVTNN